MNFQKVPHILIATDQDSNGTQFKHALSQVNVEVVCTENWETALEDLYRRDWLLVIVAVDAASTRLQELVERVVTNEKQTELRLLFVLENSEAAARVLKQLPDGTFDVLPKPAKTDWLRNKVVLQMEHNRKDRIMRNLDFKLQAEIAQNKTLVKELLQLQRKAKRLQSMQSIGVLVRNISHEFNNVLGFALGYLHMAGKTIDDIESSRGHMNKAEIGMKRAVDLVRKIQAYSCNAHYELSATQLTPLIKYAIEEIEAELPQGLNLVTDIEDPSITVQADKNQLQQVLFGLCENAVDAMGDRAGTIKLQLDRLYLDETFVRTHPNLDTGPYVRLSVIDSGIGMDESTLTRVFDPFFTTSDRRENSGMGLSLAYSIIRNHDGEVIVHSDINEGTAVCVVLPELILDDLQALAFKMQSEQVISRNEHILVVEDDPTLAQLARLMLQQQGYRVTLCDTAKEVLNCFNAAPDKWSFAVLDQTLAGIGGIELARKLIEIRPDVPIMLTGWQDQASHACVDVNIQAYLPKPYTLNGLEAALQRMFPAAQVL